MVLVDKEVPPIRGRHLQLVQSQSLRRHKLHQALEEQPNEPLLQHCQYQSCTIGYCHLDREAKIERKSEREIM